MSVFRKKHLVTQETLGEKLKKVRLGKDWTIKTASKQTRISEHHLDALEKSLYDTIPGEVYIQNFLSTYAKKLGLNPNKCLEHYAKEKHVIEQKKHSKFLNEISGIELLKLFLKPKIVKSFAISVLVLALLSYLSFNIYKTIAPPELTIYHPTSDIETNSLTINVRGQSEKEAKITINNQEILINDGGTFEEVVNLNNGLNTITIKASRKHSLEKKIIRHILVRTVKPIVCGL